MNRQLSIKKYCNKLTNGKEMVERTFNQNKFNGCKTDISETGRNLNKLMQKSQPNIVPQKIEWKSKVYESPKKISNALNQHFVETASLMAQKLKQAPCGVMLVKNSQIPSSIFLRN